MPTTFSVRCRTGDRSGGPPLSCATLPSCTRITEPMRTPLSLARVKDASTSPGSDWSGIRRSEEHTSELQSRRDLVCRLLLEKKKKKEIKMNHYKKKKNTKKK